MAGVGGFGGAVEGPVAAGAAAGGGGADGVGFVVADCGTASVGSGVTVGSTGADGAGGSADSSLDDEVETTGVGGGVFFRPIPASFMDRRVRTQF